VGAARVARAELVVVEGPGGAEQRQMPGAHRRALVGGGGHLELGEPDAAARVPRLVRRDAQARAELHLDARLVRRGDAVGDPSLQGAQRGVVHGRVAQRVRDPAPTIRLVARAPRVAVRRARDLPHAEPLGVDARNLRELRALELAVHDDHRGRGVGADGGAHSHRQQPLFGPRCTRLPDREQEPVEDARDRVEGVQVGDQPHGRLRPACRDEPFHRQSTERVDLAVAVGGHGAARLREDVERRRVTRVLEVVVARPVVVEQ
jgi:hypothetical protein